jgi:hypothetical protein
MILFTMALLLDGVKKKTVFYKWGRVVVRTIGNNWTWPISRTFYELMCNHPETIHRDWKKSMIWRSLKRNPTMAINGIKLWLWITLSRSLWEYFL